MDEYSTFAPASPAIPIGEIPMLEGTPEPVERVIGAGIAEVYDYNQRSATGTGWILMFSHCPGEK
ncbi:MAG: hypothetical protein WC382_08320 [Methanoregulaceae archaeon]